MYCSHDRTGFGNVALSAASSSGHSPMVTLLTGNYYLVLVMKEEYSVRYCELMMCH